jgi:hypothetical protein
MEKKQENRIAKPITLLFTALVLIVIFLKVIIL